ncbi:MAG: type I toxin-antitoxin system SymE family toxin [Candidatus Thiosymbion ectosymbiont of Robbea hypermnestra]|nr:type I toxin-antitoxin system SymE family toxin [Candidatus Thiosymbion ectosymbiont of Robbea hypermnestra]
MEIRHLKVRKGFRDYYLKDQSYSGYPTTPIILLKGTWLEKAGFAIDALLSVYVQQNCLILTPQDPA